MTVFKRTFVIHQNQDDSWIIKERSVDSEGNESIWPDTEKRTAREVVARLAQLMNTGPVAPQLEPECIWSGDLYLGDQKINGE